MHPRHTTFLLLSVLLTAGCVAVPHPPRPGPPPAPEGPAPAADRPPAPIPTPAWPVPAQPVPHEEIADTEPLPGTPAGRPKGRPVTRGVVGAAEEPAAGRSPERRTAKPAGAADGGTRPRARKEPRAVVPSGRRTARSVAPSASRGGPPQTSAGAPEMRRLCRQAQDIDAPMGAADLCRGLYGR
ncbi:hypothetical protein ACFCWD_09235 [Streptomyces sp. NPDC056374]|uniref:hypothetical protein n=1 Tax=unclassified Streptomyces TaxID=2593676 RepID=UPI0035D5DB8C